EPFETSRRSRLRNRAPRYARVRARFLTKLSKQQRRLLFAAGAVRLRHLYHLPAIGIPPRGNQQSRNGFHRFRARPQSALTTTTASAMEPARQIAPYWSEVALIRCHRAGYGSIRNSIECVELGVLCSAPDRRFTDATARAAAPMAVSL